MKRLSVGTYVVASVLALACQNARADKVLELNFVNTSTGAVAANDETVNPSGTDYAPANIKDDTGNFGPGQAYGFPYGKYVNGGSVPNVPSTLPPGWDGAVAYFPGTGTGSMVRWADAAGRFTGSFSAYARFNRSGLAGDVSSFDWIIGGGQPNAFGWGIYLSHAENPHGSDAVPPTLDVNLGGAFKTPMSQAGAFNGTGPAIENNKWYDVGIIYEGTPFDFVDDTLKVFLNGELIQTFTGDADFDPFPFGFSFAIGADSFANEGFKGYYDRVMLWNNALTDAEMLALMPTPDTGGLLGDANDDGVVDIFDVNVVSDNWGTAGPTGDVNDDGIVDIFDVNLISDNWGATGGGAQAVPEPAGLGLIVAGSLVAGALGRKGCFRLRPA